MAVAEPIVRKITLEDAAEAAWERVLSGEFANIGLAIRTMWPSFVFSLTDREFLEIFGMTHYARELQRDRKTSESPRVAVGAPHGRQWDAYIALSWPQMGAERQKPLLEFDLADIAACRLARAKTRDAAVRAIDWLDTTEGLLKKHKVARVGDLPSGVLREVEASAREAMGRQP